MARKKNKTTSKKFTKPAAEAQVKVTFAAAVWTPSGLHILGQGTDGRMYGWSTAPGRGWELAEATPLTADQQAQLMATQLKINQEKEAAQQAAAAQPRPKRSLKVANGATTDEAFE